MRDFINGVGTIIGATTWIMGMVLAKGFWWTLFAIVCPPYAWYKVAEMLMGKAGWL